MGGPQAGTIFNTLTGGVLQTFSTPYLSGSQTKNDSSGSHAGITYTPDGLHLLFSQDSSHVTIASVDPNTGMITSTGGSNPYPARVAVAADLDSNGVLRTVTCFVNSPPGTTGSAAIPCGKTVSGNTAYPMGIAISPDGKTAYVSNEAGRIATVEDFQGYSNGTPVVAEFPTGSTSTGTVSVVDLASFTVKGSISTGLHPTGMAWWGNYLLVANAYSDTISVIDTTSNEVVNTIHVGLPFGAPGESHPAYGTGPNSIAVDARNIAYVALYNANAIAVVDLNASAVQGLIPVGYAPSSVVLDTADNQLLVANDKGIGTTGYGVAPPPTKTAENSYGTTHGATGFNTHQDLGTVSIVNIPGSTALAAMTLQSSRTTIGTC
jgi:YVTN family beta-propeller protein